MPGRAKPLAERIARRIARLGPMTLAEYMTAALCDADHGYYRPGDPIGAGGDFVTAPEVSQMFGEIIGLWCAETWERMGAPKPFHLVELGPGRGTLMADALRATRLVPGFHDAARLYLIEASPALRAALANSFATLPMPPSGTATCPPLPASRYKYVKIVLGERGPRCVPSMASRQIAPLSVGLSKRSSTSS